MKKKIIKEVYRAYAMPNMVNYIDWSSQVVSYGNDILMSQKWSVFHIPKDKIFNKKLHKDMIPVKITVEYKIDNQSH